MATEFALVLHAHQPAGNFDAVIEDTYQRSYRPFLDAAAARPWLHLNLHYSGYLLDWIARHHGEHLALLRQLLAAGRLEMLGGGYYEPILPAIAPAERQEQIARLSACLKRHLDVTPRGMWLAERVWEPDLPLTLAQAGMEYTLLDEHHFALAGLAPEELRGTLLGEHQGATVRLFAGSQRLREAIPFRSVDEAIAQLLAGGDAAGGLLTMGDDMEKFGAWPHTYEHVFEQGWLRDFFDRLEAEQRRIETVRLSEHCRRHAPQGPVYLPAASYPEMMEWALPYAAAERARAARQQSAAPWRAFLAKYREANLLHKTQQETARRLREWRERQGAEAEGPARAAYAEAYEALLAAQANDAYWHGWFGGLYAPHLRNELWRHLVRAEARLGELEEPAPVRRLDLDCDGHDEVELRTGKARVLVAVADGGGIEQIDWLPAAANLVNSLQRRPETYHDEIRRRAPTNPAGLPGGGAAVAAGTAPAAEEASAALEAELRYDRYPRTCGRLYVFAAGRSVADYGALALGEHAGAAAGAYRIVTARTGAVDLEWREGNEWVRKEYRLSDTSAGTRLEQSVTWSLEQTETEAALEYVFNLLAERAPDRALVHENQRYGLFFRGALPAGPLTLVDGWRRLRIRLEAPEARGWWVEPIYSVSQSETGVERVYQGSAVAAVWAAGRRQAALRCEIDAEQE